MKDPATMKDKIYDMILEDILSHKYSDREVINEKDLVEKYGCSKTPIREALIALCNENVLRSIPRYGYEVVRLGSDDVIKMLKYRYAVESGVLIPEMERFHENQISVLREINETCKNSEDLWERWDLRTSFHVRMLTFAGNSYAGERVGECLRILKRAYAQFCWNNPAPIDLSYDMEYHEKILEALEEKDEEKLRNALREDIYSLAIQQIIGYLPK